MSNIDKTKTKKFKVTKKQIIIFCAAIIVLGGVGAILAFRAKAAQSPVSAQKSAVRTISLSKSTLTESVTVTGTVESTSVTNVTSALSYPVAEILVKEGESVVEGQVLAKLSTEELDKQIARAKESLSDNIKKAQSSYDDAVAQRDKAYNDAVAMESTVVSALNARQSAEIAFNAAKSSVSAFQTAYDSAASAEKTAGEALNNANTVQMSNPTDQALIDAQAVAVTNYNTASQAAKAALDALNNAKSLCGYDASNKAYESAVQSYDTQRKALDNLQNTYTNAVKSAENAASQLETAKKSDTLTELTDKLDDCVIIAQSGGTVTNVNAAVGSAPSQQSALFVIQNTDNLKVSVSIDEYDITKISRGLKAKIKSDATGDEEISGKVSQISQTAQSSAGSSMGGSSGTSFGAEVTVDNIDSGLLIGMNAQVEIIISEKTDVYTVPYDAIETDESGQSVVHKQEGSEFVPVIVQKGMETDYYVEITSSELKDKDIIRASAANNETVEESSQIQMSGGMPFVMGGEMPSGAQRTTPLEGFTAEVGGGFGK